MMKTGRKFGHIVTEETRRKISMNRKGKNIGINHPFFGKHRSDETKNKISQSNKGHLPWNNKLTMATSEKLRNMIDKRIRNNPDIGKHISLSKIGHITTEEAKQKMSKSHIGKSLTNEHKKNIGISVKRILNTPEIRQKMSTANKGRCGYWKNKKMSSESNRKRREKFLKRIETQKLNGRPLKPCIGNNETPILDYVERMLNIKIIRQYKVRSLFLDGYCPERNIAFEVDEKKHFDENGKLYEKDIRRQQEIQKELNCNFIRVNEKFVNLIKKEE